MPRKVEANSDASQKRIDKAYSQAFSGILKTLEAINNKLNEGKTLTDEELRFLKKSDSIIKAMQIREKEKDEAPAILPETLKMFIDQLEWMLSIGKPEDVIECTEYYRCAKCNELHKEGEECIFIQYQKVIESYREE